MRVDYHMHFEYGSYDPLWVQGFFDAARARKVDEIGISEHTHGFSDFRELYYRELILDDSVVGRYQRKWLERGKFRYTLAEYIAFMNLLKGRGHPVKTGIEVCNFRDHDAVRRILGGYDFDYIIGSVHFLRGWGYDFADIKSVWDEHKLEDIYLWYTEAVEDLCASGLYDILGHPFNIRLFRHFPDFDVQPYLERVASALRKANMAVDINTGTLYRYPVAEISPFPAFMKVARQYGLPIILSSDAHRPEDCGRYIDEAAQYAYGFGYDQVMVYTYRQAAAHPLTL